jgi:hypothetical protein
MSSGFGIRGLGFVVVVICKSATNPESQFPNHFPPRSATANASGAQVCYAVIFSATAVMSSFGGVSPRNSNTALKIASTIARAGCSLVS